MSGLTDDRIVGILSHLDDRAMIIMSTAIVEDCLAWALLSHFIQKLSSDEVDRMFFGYGPLSSLSAKSSLAYALGVITPEMKHDLALIKTLRNDCAHNYNQISFDDPDVSQICGKLKLPLKEGTVKFAKPLSDNLCRNKLGACVIAIVGLLAVGHAIHTIKLRVLADNFDKVREAGQKLSEEIKDRSLF